MRKGDKGDRRGFPETPRFLKRSKRVHLFFIRGPLDMPSIPLIPRQTILVTFLAEPSKFMVSLMLCGGKV